MADPQNISDLLVRIEATTAGLRRELDKGASSVDQFSKATGGKISAVEKAFDSLGISSARAGAALTAAAGGISAAIAAAATTAGALTVSVARNAKELQNLSSAANASTAEFQRYAAGAKAVGIENEKFADILKDVNDRIGEFNTTGSGQMKDFFTTIAPKVGVTAEQFKKLSGPQALQLYYDSLEKAGLSQQAMTFYLESMGDEATALIPLLRNGGAGFKAFGDEAERFGGILDDKAIKASQELNAVFYMMENASNGLKNQFATAMLPVFIQLSEVLFDVGTKSVETVGFFDVLTKSVKVLSASAVGAVASFDLVGKSIGGLVAIQEAATEGSPWYEKILPPFLAKRIYDNWDKAKVATDVVTEDLAATREKWSTMLQGIWDVGEVDTNNATKAKAQELAGYMSQLRNATQGVTIAQEQQAKSHKSSTSAIDQQKKALEELIEKSKIAFDAAQGLANGYLAGKDLLYQYTLQQKVEQELLKTGAAAREKVTAAIQAQMDAEARQDVAKGIYQLRLETDSLNAQALATLQGTDALSAYNAEKAVAAALAGKNADALSAETKLMLEAVKANQQAAKTAEQVGKVQSIMDRLKPESALLRQYTEDQKALNEAIRLNPGYSAEYAESLRLLDLEYKQNQASATAWGQFTEGAIDRVDDAFADAWKNIGKGFDGFATSLKDGFKQLLAELAHMAITKPIIMQIGAALGVGGLSASQSGGLLGSSGGGGGLNIVSLAQNAYSVYSGLTGVGSAIYGGYQVGGLTGAAQAGVGYYGNMLSNGANYVSGLFGGASGAAAGSAAASSAAGATAAGYTGQAYSTWAAGQYASQAASKVASTISSYGPYFAAIAGALQGWQAAGFKGAVAGAGGAVGGMYAGAQLGSYFGPIGTAIGGAIGAVAGAAFGSKLFGGDWQTKDAGLSLGVEGGDLSATGFEYQKKKGGLFGKNKKRTVFNALDADTQAALDMTFDAGMDQIQALYEQFGIDVSQSALDGLSIAATQISTKDKTTEELQQLIGEWFTGTFDSITDQINTAMGSQFRAGLTLDGLKLLLGNLISVNGMLDLLNVGVLKITPAGAYAAEALSALAGGMDKLTENVNGYYGAFFTEAEKQADTLSAVNAQFQAMGVALPPLRQGYRDIVSAIDVSTAAGQAMFTSLTSLWQTASSYYDILEAQAKAAAQAQAEAQASMLSGAMGTLQRAVQKQQNAIQEAYNARTEALNASLSSSQSAVSSLTSMTNSLSSALKTMLGQSDQATRVLYGQATATLETAAAIARAGGSLANFQGLDDALSTVTGNNSSGYGDWLSFARDQGRSAALIGELSATAGDQLTSAEKTVKGIQDQLDLSKKQFDLESKMLQGQLDLAQAQIDAINGVDNTLLGIAEALAQFGVAIKTASPNGTGSMNADSLIEAAYQAALGRGADKAGADYWKQQLASGAVSSNNLQNAISQAGAANGESINTAFGNILGYAPDAASLAYWQQQVANGNVTDINAAIRAAAMQNGQIPAFAAGGLYGGGLAPVGEKGPELINFNKPGYVHTAADTASMMGGGNGAVVRELQALRAENQEMRYAIASIAKHTRKTADGIQQQNEVGVATLETA